MALLRDNKRDTGKVGTYSHLKGGPAFRQAWIEGGLNE